MKQSVYAMLLRASCDSKQESKMKNVDAVYALGGEVILLVHNRKINVT